MNTRARFCGNLMVLLGLCLALVVSAGCGSDDEESQAKHQDPPQAPPRAGTLKSPPLPLPPGFEDAESEPKNDSDVAAAGDDEEPAGGATAPQIPNESSHPPVETADEPATPIEPAPELIAPERATPDEPLLAADEPIEAPAQDDDGSSPDEDFSFPPPEEPKPLEPPLESKGAKRFVEGEDLWVDIKNKRVVLAARVVQRGEHVPLELFACRKGSKEHEAIVSVKVTAFFVHACLVAVGGEFGHPVKFWTADRKPMYEAAEGCVVKITVYWDDEDGTRRSAPAQDWLYNQRTESAMEVPWVFAGSQFYKPTPTDKPFYLAEDGDLICVSNFPSALLDVPVKSSSEEANLVYRPFTKNIPPVGTPVAIVLEPEPGLREPISAPAAVIEGEFLPPDKVVPADPPAEAPPDEAPLREERLPASP